MFHHGCVVSLLVSVAVLGTVLETVLAAKVNQKFVFDSSCCDNDRLFVKNFRPQIKSLWSTLERVRDYVLNEDAGNTYDALAYFADKFGPALTCSKSSHVQTSFLAKWLAREGHENVAFEEFKAPSWNRGKEYAYLIRPRIEKLNLLGYVGSVGTNGKTIEAKVLVVKSLGELRRRADEAEGKIIVLNYNFNVTALGPHGTCTEWREPYEYVRGVIIEDAGNLASDLKAAAIFIRSLTDVSMNTPKTMYQKYRVDCTPVPVVAITVEDAEMIERMSLRGENLLIQFYSENKPSGQCTERNIVSQLNDCTDPDDVVLLTGQVDSMDVGQGCVDDGAGLFASWRTLSIIADLANKNKIPKLSKRIKFVGWTGCEENNLGSKAYARDNAADLGKISLALESDWSTIHPTGLALTTQNVTTQCVIHSLLQVLKPIGANTLVIDPTAYDAEDIVELFKRGVTSSMLQSKNDRYLWFHQNEADTMSAINNRDLTKSQAVFTVVTAGTALIKGTLPR